MTILVDFSFIYQTQTVLSFLLIPLIILWMYHLRTKSSRLYTMGNKLPGPTALPIFGNVLMALGKRPEGKSINFINIFKICRSIRLPVTYHRNLKYKLQTTVHCHRQVYLFIFIYVYFYLLCRSLSGASMNC